MRKMQLLTLSLAVVLSLIAGASLVDFPALAAEPRATGEEITSTPNPAALETTPPAQPMALIPSTCEPMGTTDDVWGMGADCAAAQINMNVNLLINGIRI